MTSDQVFDLFYELISKKALAICGIGRPELPRKRNELNYSLLLYFGDRSEASNSANAYHPSTAHQHFKVVYFEAIDSIVFIIKNQFE